MCICCCRREIPEVPSCRRRNYLKRFDGFDFSDDEGEDPPNNTPKDTSDVSALDGKMMANSLVVGGAFKNGYLNFLSDTIQNLPELVVQQSRFSLSTMNEFLERSTSIFLQRRYKAINLLHILFVSNFMIKV